MKPKRPEQTPRPSDRTWPRAVSAASAAAGRAAVLLAVATLASSEARAAEGNPEGELPTYRFSLSTTYLTATNPFPNSVSMYELHVGYRVTPRDVVALKACSWKLFEPMGIPWWDSHLQQESEFYPGKIHEYGLGISYQRFLWKGLFASIQVVPLRKRYLDEDGKQIGTGFKLYTSYHLGYRLSFFGDRLFVEPQVHVNYWPVDTRGPAGFEAMERRWPKNYFLFEPNLFIGVNL